MERMLRPALAMRSRRTICPFRGGGGWGRCWPIFASRRSFWRRRCPGDWPLISTSTCCAVLPAAGLEREFVIAGGGDVEKIIKPIVRLDEGEVFAAVGGVFGAAALMDVGFRGKDDAGHRNAGGDRRNGGGLDLGHDFGFGGGFADVFGEAP